MKKPIVLVTGGSGFLGGHLVSAFGERCETCYTFFSHPERKPAGARGMRLDLADGRATAELVATVRPGLILHAAARTDFNLCAADPLEAHRINVQGTENIARCAAGVGARLINFSTDMVFAGTGPMSTEEDVPIPCCTYGRTKLAAEAACCRQLENLLNVRLSLIYGISLTGSRCHWENMANTLKSGQKVRAFANEFRTPLYVGDVTEILLDIAFREDVRGILHLAGPHRMNRHKLAVMTAQSLSLPADRVMAVSSDGLFPEQRPLDCSLGTRRLAAWRSGAMTPAARAVNRLAQGI